MSLRGTVIEVQSPMQQMLMLPGPYPLALSTTVPYSQLLAPASLQLSVSLHQSYFLCLLTWEARGTRELTIPSSVIVVLNNACWSRI